MNVPCFTLLWRVSFSHVQDVGDGWWEGQLPNGQSGLFPEAYVEVSGEVCCVHAYIHVRLCMCVCCVCAYIHVRLCTCVLCVCVHTCTFVYVCALCVCVYVHVRLCTWVCCVCAYIHIRMCVRCVCVYVHVRMCTFMCVDVGVHVCGICMYILHRHKHTYV